MQELADKNMREGREFMKQHALKDGVKQLENGMQYSALETGDGPMPKITDRIKVHFVGTTLAGKEFESTRTNQQPAVIPVGGIGIRGIVEALLRMNVGSKWQVVIPPDLAYGVAGAPPDIEPNQTLIFEIELIEIVK
jgi:FKBP-type peptidyl-prolyl cis-trans isomerase